MRAVPAATMQKFLDAWLDELPATDALRLGAACRRAREALGAGGVAAAAFAVTRPWRAEPESSLRLWRTAWEACASASSDLGLPGGAWLKTGTVILTDGPRANSSVADNRAIIQVAYAIPPTPSRNESFNVRPIPPPCLGCTSDASGVFVGISWYASRGPLGSSFEAS